MRITFAGVLIAAALTVVAACSGSASSTSASAAAATPTLTGSPSSGAEESYVSQVSALCATLAVQESAVVTSIPPHFPVADFLADTARIQPLLTAFDVKVLAVQVRPADRAAAAAFTAYVKESTATRLLRVAAARRGQTYYDAEYDRQMKLYANDPVLEAIDNLGYSGDCHYR